MVNDMTDNEYVDLFDNVLHFDCVREFDRGIIKTLTAVTAGFAEMENALKQFDAETLRLRALFF